MRGRHRSSTSGCTRSPRTLAAYNKANPDKPAAPFAINQIVHKSNDRLEHDMEMVVKYKVPIVITSLGARTDVNDAVHSYGGVTLHDIINNTFAKKAIEKGADGLIAVAAGAGGHAGVKSPFALIQEIRQWFDGPLALSGSIATGGAVLAAQAMGADFAYIGSAFIATEEARASDEYKQAIVDGTSRRHRLLQPVHRRARQLPRAEHRGRGHGPGQPARRRPEDDELRRRRRQQGQGLEGHLGLGQGIGAVTEVTSAAALVARLKREYPEAQQRLLPRESARGGLGKFGYRPRRTRRVRERRERGDRKLVNKKTFYASSFNCPGFFRVLRVASLRRKYSRNQHSAMLIDGKRMWKVMLAANCMRESRSVSMGHGLCAGRGRLAFPTILRELTEKLRRLL